MQDRQSAWAQHRGLEPDRHSYLLTVNANLRAPLSTRTEAAFRRGGGGELADRPPTSKRLAMPAKMRALHSSAALAANVFDYWTDRSKQPLWRALSIEGGTDFLFEAEFATGLPGTPPTLDLAVLRRDSATVGVESKFTEWLARRPKNEEPLKPKYFDGGRRRWRDVGLPRCQELADSLRTAGIRYTYLHAPQLLKHCLGLATQQSNTRLALLYLFYDAPGKEAATHHSELDAFGRAVADDLDFSVLTYQDLFRRLERERTSESSEYVDYLAGRYFEAAA